MTPRTERLVVVGASALLGLAVAWALPVTGSVQDAPAAAKGGDAREVDLLTSPPFDRLTLTDGSVVRIEPVLPRPLPPYDAVKEKKKRDKRYIPPEGNIPLPGQKADVRVRTDPEDDEDPGTLTIHLLEGDVRDFWVKRMNIKSIEYYEDLLLAEADSATQSRDFTRAFECLLKVRVRSPSWKGQDDLVDRLLFAEGSAALLDNDGESGLRLLGELFARKPDFHGLADKLATSFGSRASRAFDLGLYARGRKILHDVGPMAPDHVYLRQVRERFVRRASDLVQSASKVKGAGRLDRLTEALRIWPSTEGADAEYRKAFEAEPTVSVAVDDVPRGAGPWVRSPADARVTRLLYLPVLSRDDDEAAHGKAAGQLAAEVSTTDLGRRLVIRLRPDVPWSDGSRSAGAIDVQRALTDAAEPGSPQYSARWADLLDRVEVPEPAQVEVRLTRVFLNPGAWLVGPVGPAHAAVDGRISPHGRRLELVGDGLFRWSPSSNPGRVELIAADPTATGDASSRPRVRRITEVRHGTAAQTLGAFTRGEVSLIEHVPPDRVAGLAANPSFRVGRYARPRVHWIALDGRNPALRNRSLRRGLSTAIDRRTLLEETLVRRPADDVSLVSDGPFPRGSVADAPDVKPLGYEPVLARMLIAAARKELGGQPITLKFEYPAAPEAQAVVPRIVEAFNRVGKPVGLEVVAAERPESELEAGLRSGRRFDLAYRAALCDEPVTDAGPLLSPAYDAAPTTNPLGSVASPRILQLLLQLERATEWPTARGIATLIDRECRDELPVLPLWQLEDHYAWHTRLKGPKDVADKLYEGIETWEVEPWYVRDPW